MTDARGANILAFGAVPGEPDSTHAFNAAAAAHGTGPVTVPPGKWRFTSLDWAYHNIALIGAGYGYTILEQFKDPAAPCPESGMRLLCCTDRLRLLRWWPS